MRPALLLCACILTASFPLAGQHAAASPPCTPTPFLAGTQLTAVAANGRATINFTLTAATTGPIGFQIAQPTTDPVSQASTGRTLVSVLLENSTGNLQAPSASLLSYSYGVHVGGDLTTLDVPLALGPCNGWIAYNTPTLAAGNYRLVVLAASEADVGLAAVLPSGASVTATQTGSVTLVSEATLTCSHNLRATIHTVSSTDLVDCTQAISTTGHTYATLTAGQADAIHHVRLLSPSSVVADPVFAFASVANGTAGTWTVDVPLYVTPVAAGTFFVHDSGVFGVFADIP